MRRMIALFLCIWLLPVRAEAAQTTQYVALTFDDGPSGRYTRRLLDGLDARGVKATFLLCGYRLKEDPDTARRIHEAGHEIGLHGYSHKNMRKLTKEEIRQRSREAGLFTWDKPAYACLATRVPTGTKITAELLQKVEKAEEVLMKMRSCCRPMLRRW